MRVYFSTGSDPMITDTVEGLNVHASRIATFLDSGNQHLYMEGDASGSPLPHEIFLPGIEVAKSSGPILVTLDPGLGLRVSGSVENLRIWGDHFKFPPDAVEGDHRHPEYVHRADYLDPRSLSVIIEVRDEDEDAL